LDSESICPIRYSCPVELIPQRPKSRVGGNHGSQSTSQSIEDTVGSANTSLATEPPADPRLVTPNRYPSQRTPHRKRLLATQRAKQIPTPRRPSVLSANQAVAHSNMAVLQEIFTSRHTDMCNALRDRLACLDDEAAKLRERTLTLEVAQREANAERVSKMFTMELLPTTNPMDQIMEEMSSAECDEERIRQDDPGQSNGDEMPLISDPVGALGDLSPVRAFPPEPLISEKLIEASPVAPGNAARNFLVGSSPETSLVASPCGSRGSSRPSSGYRERCIDLELSQPPWDFGSQRPQDTLAKPCFDRVATEEDTSVTAQESLLEGVTPLASSNQNFIQTEAASSMAPSGRAWARHEHGSPPIDSDLLGGTRGSAHVGIFSGRVRGRADTNPVGTMDDSQGLSCVGEGADIDDSLVKSKELQVMMHNARAEARCREMAQLQELFIQRLRSDLMDLEKRSAKQSQWQRGVDCQVLKTEITKVRYLVRVANAERRTETLGSHLCEAYQTMSQLLHERLVTEDHATRNQALIEYLNVLWRLEKSYGMKLGHDKEEMLALVDRCQRSHHAKIQLVERFSQVQEGLHLLGNIGPLMQKLQENVDHLLVLWQGFPSDLKESVFRNSSRLTRTMGSIGAGTHPLSSTRVLQDTCAQVNVAQKSLLITLKGFLEEQQDAAKACNGSLGSRNADSPDLNAMLAARLSEKGGALSDAPATTSVGMPGAWPK